MPIIPYNGICSGPIITPLSMESLGWLARSVGATSSTPASATWPTANKAFYIPFYVAGRSFTVRRIAFVNGATASGNVDVGVYDAAGNRLVSMGSTAQSGTSQAQWLNVADTTLAPDRLYYMAAAMNNTTGTSTRWAPTLEDVRTAGVFVETSAFALPSTATFAVADVAFIPMLVLSSWSD